EYDPMHESQERRGAAALRGAGSDDDSDQDPLFTKHVARMRANRLRREAARGLDVLTDISNSPRPSQRQKRDVRDVVQESDPAADIIPRSSDESPKKKKGMRTARAGRGRSGGAVVMSSPERQPSGTNETYVPATSSAKTPTQREDGVAASQRRPQGRRTTRSMR